MNTAGKVIESGLWFKELSDNCLKRRNWNVAKADTRKPVSTIHEKDGISECDVWRSEQRQWI